MVSLVIHHRDVHCHCNVATQLARATSLDNIVRNRVRLIHNVLADKFVPMVNAERDVIQEHVSRVNCVKMALVLLAAEIT